MPTALKTSECVGLAAATGCGGVYPDGDGIDGLIGGDAGALAKIPPCSVHICVGWVPIRNGNSTWRGHAEVARPPDSGSIVAIVTPDGSGKSSGSAGAASSMNWTHAGNAACAPVRPRLSGVSKPTQTPQTISGV